MTELQQPESEWRVELTKKRWLELLEEASLISERVSKRVADVVYGRHGFDSVLKDGWIVRIRGPAPFRLELKERLAAGDWLETSVGVDSADALNLILRKVGLKAHLVLDRTRHELGDSTYILCFDDIRGLGTFVEVERGPRPANGSSLDAVVQELSNQPRMPPYGDIVRSRMQTDPHFEAQYSALIRDFSFGGQAE